MEHETEVAIDPASAVTARESVLKGFSIVEDFGEEKIQGYQTMYALARAMLSTGPRSTPPKHRAVKKMVRYLLASPLHLNTMRHQRGSWRSWPRNIGKEVIDAARTAQSKHA